MIELLAKTLVFVGALILVWGLMNVRQLMTRLPHGPLRRRWYAMTGLIVLFIAGYLGYVGAFWNAALKPLDLIVPVMFFFGACFVGLTAVLALQTAKDLRRVSLLERETFTDPLTGLFNRRYLDRRLKEEVAAAQRYGMLLSLLMLDIDHFKKVNDTHGHLIGDQVLVFLGATIAGELRETDILARYGGEEFVVMALHTSPAGAVDLAERLRLRIESREFRGRDDRGGEISIRLTVSVGVAFCGADMDSMEKLIHAADENLYRAKQQGRNRVVAGDLAVEGASPQTTAST